jgi:cytochrome P450
MLGFFGFVLSRPAVLARLRQEIDDAVRTGRVVLPASYAQGVQLDYFQACLKETLRLWPAVAHPMERIVPCGEAIHVDKFVLPPGTVVGTSALVFHRSYEAFGDDADQFKPERWLGIDEATRKTLEKNNIAFGAGGRVNISLMELTKVIPQLLYRYDMSFTPREKGSPHRHLRGKDLDGKVAKEVPYYVEVSLRSTLPVSGRIDGIPGTDARGVTTQSDWFVHPKDFWCNVAMRPIEDGL